MKPALQLLSFTSLKTNMAAWNAGKPPEEHKLLPHTSSTSSRRGRCLVYTSAIGCRVEINRLAQSLLGWETPTPPPFSQRGIHYNNKLHSCQGHSLSGREISDGDLCLRQAERCCLCHVSPDRSAEVTTGRQASCSTVSWLLGAGSNTVRRPLFFIKARSRYGEHVRGDSAARTQTSLLF